MSAISGDGHGSVAGNSGVMVYPRIRGIKRFRPQPIGLRLQFVGEAATEQDILRDRIRTYFPGIPCSIPVCAEGSAPTRGRR